MLGLLAAFIAIYLGVAGPHFRWRGVAWLSVAAVIIGIVATIAADRETSARGGELVVTPASIVLGLFLQALFMLTFYGLAKLARWSWRGLTRDPAEIPPSPED